MLNELVKGCKQQNPARQRELFGLFVPLMMTVCRRYTSETAEAEDILQEAFIKVFRSIDQFDEQRGSLEGWIRRITVNTAIEHWRRRNKRFLELNHGQVPDQPVVAEADLCMAEEEILQLIAGLPPGFRLIFNLYAIEGYSHAEIAQQLRITESTSRSQLARARRLLQEALQPLQNTVSYEKF